MRTYTNAFSTLTTPQSEPIPGSTQTPNAAGGYGWDVDDWTRLSRFLILGTEGGTYYIGERKLTIDNAQAVLRCIKADGARVLRTIVDVSSSGRAPKTDPAIFALAMCMKLGDDATRKAAAAVVSQVCRIGTHLFALAEAVQAFGGWGRGTKRAFSDWYTTMPEDKLAYQAMKYQSRNGWAHRDLLRLAKPSGHGPDTTRGAVFHWITKGWPSIGDAPHPDPVLARLWAFERAKQADDAETVRLIETYGLPRECVATQRLNTPAVWDALLRSGDGMPLTAMVRNLAKMTSIGLLAPMSEAAGFVVDRLGDAEYLRRSRVHPLALLVALRTYQRGHGDKGSLSWSPVASVVDALDRAFYASFANVTPTGKRFLVGVDVSGSMRGTQVAGLSSLSACEAAAAIGLVTAATELNHAFVAFDTVAKALDISPRQRLDDVTRRIEALVSGGTDCAVPIHHAMRNGIGVDCFVILTDSETWQGQQHPAQAIVEYRRRTGIPAKMAVVAMASNQTSIADPGDGAILNLVGLDTSAPALIADFAR